MSNINSIFDPKRADLSGISPETSGLYVEELVQMVTFKVEAEYSKANFLTGEFKYKKIKSIILVSTRLQDTTRFLPVLKR